MSANLKEGENKHKAKALASKDRKSKGRGSAPDVVTCPGWTDEYGNWNTGFACPKWGGVEDEYCCGSAHNRYCCPQPEPIAPTETSGPGGELVPLIAGAAAGVGLIVLVVIICFCCPCCLAFRWIKRTRKPNKDSKKDGEAALPVCQHCHATMTMTSSGMAETLACGCEVGGPPGNHHFTGGEPDLVLHLYENPYVENQKPSHTPQHNHKTWTQIPDSDPEMSGSLHFDEPPPYDKSLMSGARHDDPDINRFSPCSEDTPMIHRLQSPSKLCMKTFRPLGVATSLSPLSVMLRTPREAANIIDQSRRDSGILFDNEDQEQNSNKNYNGNEPDDPENDEDQDTYHESIVVPKFKFQSLSLVNKSGLNSSGLSHSRTSGLSGSRGRTRKSRSSVDSLELEHLDQLIESMNIQTQGLSQAS